MRKKEISIIVPVFNASLFLRESLESILNQTFKDFELICINDASDDTSAEILQEYADLDDRLSLLTNNVRQGAAESRNRGMEVAKGNYLLFLDSDDIFEEDMLELAHNVIEKHQADIVVYESLHMPTDKIHENIKVMHSELYRERYCKSCFYLKDYSPNEILRWTNTAWDKLYRRSFIEEKKIKFQSLPCNNDVYFVVMALLSDARLIALDTDKVMIHVRDHSSIDRISSKRDPMCSFKAFKKIQETLIEKNLFEKMHEYFYYKAFISFYFALRAAKDEEQAKAFYDFLEEEGINSLCKEGKLYNSKSTKFIINQFDIFKNNSFESQWYAKDPILKILLKINGMLLIKLIETYKQNGAEIYVWGIGKNGRLLIDFLDEIGLVIDGIVDIDENKKESYYQNYRIGLPKDLLYEKERKYLIIATSLSAMDSACNLVGNDVKTIIVVNIKSVLYR